MLAISERREFPLVECWPLQSRGNSPWLNVGHFRVEGIPLGGMLAISEWREFPLVECWPLQSRGNSPWLNVGHFRVEGFPLVECSIYGSIKASCLCICRVNEIQLYNTSHYKMLSDSPA